MLHYCFNDLRMTYNWRLMSKVKEILQTCSGLSVTIMSDLSWLDVKIVNCLFWRLHSLQIVPPLQLTDDSEYDEALLVCRWGERKDPGTYPHESPHSTQIRFTNHHPVKSWRQNPASMAYKSFLLPVSVFEITWTFSPAFKLITWSLPSSSRGTWSSSAT